MGERLKYKKTEGIIVKKRLMLAMSVFLVFLLATALLGCMPGEAEPEPDEDPVVDEPVEPIELVFASATAPGTTENLAVEKFKEIVEEKTNGVITVNFFPGGALGGEVDNLEQLKIGEIHMSVLGDITTTTHAPEYDPTTLPFIFPDLESAVEFKLRGPFSDEINRALEERGGITLLGLSQRGARQLTANVRVETPEDLKGIRLRVPEIPAWVTIWETLGPIPTPVAWPEVYTALQLGVVEAQENPFENIYTPKFYEVQDYVMLTEHLFGMFHWVAAVEFLDALTPEHREIIAKAVTEATAWADAQIVAREEEIKEKLTELGMEIVEVDKAAFAEAALPGVKKVSEGWAPGVWDEIKVFLGE